MFQEKDKYKAQLIEVNLEIVSLICFFLVVVWVVEYTSVTTKADGLFYAGKRRMVFIAKAVMLWPLIWGANVNRTYKISIE